MAWLHTWAGIVFSLLLYFVFITGSFGYFNSEITHWMQPDAPRPELVSDPELMLQTGFDYLHAEYPDASRHLVSLPSQRESHLVYVFANLKAPNADGDTSIFKYLDPTTGQPAALRETGGGSALYAMHYALHYMPYDVAIYIVGLGTLLMLLAVITGIVTHKRIFTDFFTLRLAKGQRSWLDSHNMTSVLALPFIVMITYSGLVFYTFEYSPGVMFLSMGVDEDAQKTMRSHLRPGFEIRAPSGETRPVAPISGPLAVLQERWPGAEPRFADVFNPGDANATLRVGRRAARINRGSDILYFDGSSGELLAEPAGMPGDSVFSSVLLALHEGRFSGYPLRWLYFISGLLGAAMIATGSLLWAKKRRNQIRDNRAAPAGLRFVERCNVAVIVGLPIGVLAYFWANRLLPLGLEARPEWELHVLFMVWALSFLHAGIRERRRAWREQVAVLAMLCLLLPVVNGLTSDAHLLASLTQGNWTRASFDLTAVAFGLALWATWSRLIRPAATTAASPERPRVQQTNEASA